MAHDSHDGLNAVFGMLEASTIIIPRLIKFTAFDFP